jgi:GNAT superfamily N-acetyltransferase
MEDPMPTLDLRPATPADVNAIVALIRDLAVYEELAHEVQADPAALEAHLFGPTPVAEVLMGRVDGEVAGFALYFTNYSTFLTKPGIYLEDLFVRPEHRGVGLGKALLKRLAAIAVERGCGRFEWSVLDWNQPSIDFYVAHGARPMDGWTTYRVTGPALTELAGQG